MPTTVRIRDEDKKIIDRLQARYVLATGKRISIEHLMSLVVEAAEQHEDEIILKDEPVRLTPEQIKAMEEGIEGSGRITREEDIDDILYGGEDAA